MQAAAADCAAGQPQNDVRRMFDGGPGNVLRCDASEAHVDNCLQDSVSPCGSRDVAIIEIRMRMGNIRPLFPSFIEALMSRHQPRRTRDEVITPPRHRAPAAMNTTPIACDSRT